MGRRRRARPRAGRRAHARSRRRWSRAASSPTASDSGTRCSPRPRFDESAPVPHRRPRPRAVGLARDGVGAGPRARGALLPLQRAAPHPRPGPRAVRAAADAAPRDVRGEHRDDVGAAFDRAWATDLAIPNGLGRHDNDGMFSFYVARPGRVPDRVRPRRPGDHRRLGRQPPLRPHQRWGHQALRQS